MKRNGFFLATFFFLLLAVGISVRAFWLSDLKKTPDHYRTRIITPAAPGSSEQDSGFEDLLAYEEDRGIKVPLGENEFAVSVLNHYFNENATEDQIVAYRNLSDAENPIFITYIGYDERLGTYRRIWNAPTGASMPATVSLYTRDMLGDRSTCIVVTGMNANNEHTMTIYRNLPNGGGNRTFEKIVDVRVDGSVTIQEAERPVAYQKGIAKGQPFLISAYRRDSESNNMLDRIETLYSYNQTSGVYEQSKVTRVPGSQVEQRRVREILTGEPKVFENFINDLWYHVSPLGTVDRNQYLYFDPSRREIIFYGDGFQQIFTWQNSGSTRYGLYISSQNISVATLRRFLNIELESLDSLRVKVVEDVRLKISVVTTWDGSYRRAGSVARVSSSAGSAFQPFIDAAYDSLTGRITFFPNGEYEFGSVNSQVKGRYVFFQAGGNNLLEIRPEQNSPPPWGAPPPGHSSPGQQFPKDENGENRLIFHVTAAGRTDTDREKTNTTGPLPAGNISLLRIRLGVTGIQDLHEGQIALTRVILH